MRIKLLPPNLVNQIAAGEVIERPASVLKELIENAIDAKADKIIAKVIDAGKSFISVSDNGCGMDAESLKMCIMSHATSKLSDDNLFNIHTMGFRGEALPSIISIARVSIASSVDEENGHKIQLEGANCVDFAPMNCSKGTVVEVRDLFFSTPARLKFLKSDAIEMDHCYTIFNRIALANPHVSMELRDEKRVRLHYDKANDLQKRISDVCGEQVQKNIFKIDKQQGGMHLYGFLGVPTFNRASNDYQYFFVNNRFIKDRIFFAALKSAYSTLVPTGRYPVAILYFDIEPTAIDVNVHPTKTEIRFRNEDKVRNFIIPILKDALFSYGATKVSTQLIDKFIEDTSSPLNVMDRVFGPGSGKKELCDYGSALANLSARRCKEYKAISPIKTADKSKNATSVFSSIEEQKGEQFLGNALCQIHDTYIVAIHNDDLIIVDQHAAAERITLEKLKSNLTLESQSLLLPETCKLTASQVEYLDRNRDFLISLGVHYEKISADTVVIKALPALLETSDAKQIIEDISDELVTFGNTYSLEEKVHRILSTISCHGSLRANHMLSKEAMNSLLRQMEHTPNIGQCCHGRPSYVVLSLKDLNKFFERT